MSHPVCAHPGAISCGKCGQIMRSEPDWKPGETHMRIFCWNSRCEQYDLPLVYPVTMLELEKAE